MRSRLRAMIVRRSWQDPAGNTVRGIRIRHEWGEASRSAAAIPFGAVAHLVPNLPLSARSTVDFMTQRSRQRTPYAAAPDPPFE